MVLVGVLEWPLWCLKLVKATIMLTMVDEFSNDLLSNCHMSLNVSAWPRRLRESQDPGRNVDHVSDEPKIASTTIPNVRTKKTMLHLSQPDVSMPDPGSPETPDETAETSEHC